MMADAWPPVPAEMGAPMVGLPLSPTVTLKNAVPTGMRMMAVMLRALPPEAARPEPIGPEYTELPPPPPITTAVKSVAEAGT